MFAEILHELAEEIKGKEAEWTDLLKQEFSYQEIEREILDVESCGTVAGGFAAQSRASVSGGRLFSCCIASVVASGIARRPDSQETGASLQAMEKPSVERPYCRFTVSDYADGQGESQEENAEGYGILRDSCSSDAV